MRTELDVQFGLRTEVTRYRSDQGPNWTPTVRVTLTVMVRVSGVSVILWLVSGIVVVVVVVVVERTD